MISSFLTLFFPLLFLCQNEKRTTKNVNIYYEKIESSKTLFETNLAGKICFTDQKNAVFKTTSNNTEYVLTDLSSNLEYAPIELSLIRYTFNLLNDTTNLLNFSRYKIHRHYKSSKNIDEYVVYFDFDKHSYRIEYHMKGLFLLYCYVSRFETKKNKPGFFGPVESELIDVEFVRKRLRK